MPALVPQANAAAPPTLSRIPTCACRRRVHRDCHSARSGEPTALDCSPEPDSTLKPAIALVEERRLLRR
ncbi:MAG: hypothetical protein R2854_22600 [Caldilineaceae bacterium]